MEFWVLLDSGGLGFGDILGYFGDVLSFVGTVALGAVAVHQTREANSLSRQLVDLELEQRKPHIDVIQGQKYNLCFTDEEIAECLNEYDCTCDMMIRPRYIKKIRHGYITTIAVMRIDVENIGSSDIRRIFVKSNYCYLTVRNSNEFEDCIVYGSIMGNTFIKQGEKKKLYIEFIQELNEDEEISQQTRWVSESIHMLPAFDFDLEIITSDNISYEEKLWCETDIVSFKKEPQVIERKLNTVETYVNRN